MIYIFYGEDTYRSRKRLNELIAGAKEKAGPNLDFHRIDAEETDASALRHALEAQSLFAQKKLVVVERPFLAGWDADTLINAAKSARGKDGVMVLFWNGMLSARERKSFDAVIKCSDKAQEFIPLTGLQLQVWIRAEAKARDLELSPQEVIDLAATGNDSWMIAHEIEKRCLGGGFGAGQHAVRTIFQLGDTFFTHPREAAKNLLNLLQQGEEDMGLFSYISGLSRNIVIVQAYGKMKKSVSPKHGIHPFVEKKAAAAAAGMNEERPRGYVRRFFEEDVKIKTGESNPRDSLFRILIEK